MLVHIKNSAGYGGVDIIAVMDGTTPDTSDGSIVMDYAALEYDTHWEYAYRLRDGKLVVDVSAVRRRLVEKIREERAALFGPLDLEFMRALESDDPAVKAAVVAKKERLRRITEHPLLTTEEDVEKLRYVNLNVLMNTPVDLSGASVVDLSGNV